MLPLETLKDLLSQKFSDGDKAMICLAVKPAAPRMIKEISEMAYASGWRSAKKKNLSLLLTRKKGQAIRTDSGWELTSNGKRHVADLVRPFLQSPVPMVASALRTHLSGISDADTRSFVEEAIACFESGQHRAAVVLSWVGAVSVIQNHVVEKKLNEFNQECQKRNVKWKPAKSADDLGLLKEDTLLDVLQSISVIGKNVKLELKKGLTLRNGCGHPNSLKLAEHKVSSHIEDLVLNVFAVF